jgi:hypothetical protein
MPAAARPRVQPSATELASHHARLETLARVSGRDIAVLWGEARVEDEAAAKASA